MVLEKDIKSKEKPIFNGWNVAMAMIHINPRIREIFPKSETLNPEEIYPSKLLTKYQVRL
jgi:hypothetical protein